MSYFDCPHLLLTEIISHHDQRLLLAEQDATLSLATSWEARAENTLCKTLQISNATQFY
jgi:hypothetical protein